MPLGASAKLSSVALLANRPLTVTAYPSGCHTTMPAGTHQQLGGFELEGATHGCLRGRQQGACHGIIAASPLCCLLGGKQDGSLRGTAAPAGAACMWAHHMRPSQAPPLTPDASTGRCASDASGSKRHKKQAAAPW